MNETWIHHFTPESNRQSAKWTAAGESRPQRPKMQTLASKVLASVFWDAQSILSIDYLKKRRTINSEYYIALLVGLKKDIAKKTATNEEESALFQDNTLCHKLIASMAKLHESHFELLLHPPYFLDLASCDYWLFADPKRMFQVKRFGSNEEVISETEAYFEAKDKSFNKKVIELLEKRWNQCINLVIFILLLLVLSGYFLVVVISLPPYFFM